MSLAQRLMEFPPLVRIYESVLWRRNPLVGLAFGIGFDAELAAILAATAPARDACVLDVACGPGIYTRPFARRVPAGRVLGVDLSEPMLRTAVRLARADGLVNVAFVRGSALTLPVRDGTVDVIACCAALHLFPDVPRALAAMYRALAPGGHVALAVFRQRAGLGPAALNVARRRLLGVVPFRPGELEALLGRAGFAACRVLHDGRIWLVLTARKPPAA